MLELETRNIKHVFGQVVKKKGAVLCYVTPWDAKQQCVLNEVLDEHFGGQDRHSSDFTAEIFGSAYAVSYRITELVECITIREGSLCSRPLGDSETGPHVSQLHFYCFSSDKEWRVQQLGEEIEIPAAPAVAA